MIKRIKLKNKKGNAFVLVLFFLVLFTILIAGFGFALISSALNIVGDEVTPIFQDLGVIGPTNFSEIAEYSIVPLNVVLQSFTFLSGVALVLMFAASIVFIIYYRTNPNPVVIAFYIPLVLLLVIGSMVMANVYEDAYTGDSKLAIRLQEHTISSFLILYSPFIMSLIAVITGIFFFAGKKEEGIV